MDMTHSDATTLGKSRTGSDVNEGVLRIPERSSISRTSLSDCLESYLGHTLAGVGTYSYAEMQSVYSTVTADETKNVLE